MKSIYDMMGKYTYPAMREEAPQEHVESFFQVKLESGHLPVSVVYCYNKKLLPRCLPWST